MKRRTFMQAAVVAPALARSAEPQPGAQNAGALQNGRVPAGPPVMPPGETETVNIPVVPADQTSEEQVTAFNDEQMRTFRHLAELLVPPYNGMPGANEARAPEFLAFLIGSSSREQSDLYVNGLERLNRDSRDRFKTAFAATSPEQAAELLAPLCQKWEYEAPLRNDFRAFLVAAKRDLLRATVNSRLYVEAVSQVRRPRNASRYYWFPVV